MLWIGWLLALVAIGVAAWLWRELGAERAQASELLYAKMDSDNQLEALREGQAAESAAGDSMLAVAERLDLPLASMRGHLDDMGAQLADYRERVKQFDLAVQYCLQPVEMIFGADKATLDQLVHHVEGARRKLFEARAALEKSPLHSGAGSLDGGLGEVEVLADYARALRLPIGVIAPAEQTDSYPDTDFDPPLSASRTD
jgi:hypothetical protein